MEVLELVVKGYIVSQEVPHFDEIATLNPLDETVGDGVGCWRVDEASLGW